MSGTRRQGSDTPQFETDRLVLRPVTAKDAAALHRISNETGVRRYLWDDEPVGKATIRAVISQSIRMFSERGIGLFGARRRGSEDLIGFCGFVQLEGMEEPELAYELTPRQRGAMASPPRHPWLACATPSKMRPWSVSSPGPTRRTSLRCA